MVEKMVLITVVRMAVCWAVRLVDLKDLRWDVWMDALKVEHSVVSKAARKADRKVVCSAVHWVASMDETTVVMMDVCLAGRTVASMDAMWVDESAESTAAHSAARSVGRSVASKAVS